MNATKGKEIVGNVIAISSASCGRNKELICLMQGPVFVSGPLLTVTALFCH